MNETRDLNAELDVLRVEMLDACKTFAQSRMPTDFRAWREATGRFLVVHRMWWARDNPNIPYENVFGGSGPLDTPPAAG